MTVSRPPRQDFGSPQDAAWKRDITDSVRRLRLQKSSVATGRIASSSGTITATAGRILLIFGSGAWGNNIAAQTVTLNYNGSAIASHAVSQAALADRVGINLIGRVTAVASASVSITTSGGTLYDSAITWMEVG